jgi:putative DNA primase/helicase
MPNPDNERPVLPASVEVERAILGSLFLGNGLWRAASEALQPEDFSLESHVRIFRSMLELGRRDGSFDSVTLAAHLETGLDGVGGSPYLSDLECGGIERTNIKPLCDLVRDKAVLRRIVREGEKLQEAARTPGATSGDCRERVAQLLTVLDAARSNRLQVCTASEFLTMEIAAREMVLAPILPVQGLVMLYSKRGVGKTYLGLGIALAVARGGTFLRWKAPKPRKVLFVDGELPASTLQDRIRSIEIGVPGTEPDSPSADCLRIITPDMQKQPMPDLATYEGQALIESELSGAELLVLDNLSALCRSGKENEGESWLPVQQWLLRLRQQGLSVLLAHHAGKSGAQRGTSRREDLLDTVINLQHPSDYLPSEGLRCEVRYEKNRGFHGEDAKPFEVRMTLEGSGAARWSVKDAEDALLQRAVALFQERISIRDAAEELGISKGRAERLRKRAQREGVLAE